MRSEACPDIGGNAPLACLFGENLPRLVSLWDIVNLFNCAKLQIVLKRIWLVREMLNPSDNKSARAIEEWLEEKAREQGQTELPTEARDALQELRQLETELNKPVEEAIQKLREFCEEAQFSDTLLAIRFAEHHMRNDPSPAELRSELRHLEEALLLDLIKRKFLWVHADYSSFLNQDSLFGDDVNEAFPSAMRDIKEAGNCLAAECPTGAVFHLMRAAEVALRVLAVDRGVEYPDASVDIKQVGDLLSALDGKMAVMRNANAKLWPSKDVKDAQINFYHMALVEFRDFNEAWRKHMAHAHSSAFYDCPQAQSVFNHVRDCMRVLSRKISERAVTPLYWDNR